MRVGSFPYRLGLVIASLAIWILLIVLGHSHDPKIANLGGMPDEKHRKARAVASDISSSLQPPEIPDRGAVGFRSKVQRQIELTEKQLKLFNMIAGREEMDLKNSVSGIQALFMIEVVRDKTMTDLSRLRARLTQIGTEDWGSDTAEVRKRSEDALRHLDRYEEYKTLIGVWDGHLDKLRKALSPQG